MSKSSLRELFVLLIILLLVILPIFSSLSVSNVKATQTYPTPTLKIQLTSPTNKTYNQNLILINFSFQKQPDDGIYYRIGYAVEGEKANYSGTFLEKSLIGLSQLNFTKTITGIPDGTYLLTVSARWIGSGMMMYLDADKKTVTFTIDTKISTPSPTPTPAISPTPDNQQTLNTEAIIGIAIIVAVLGTGTGLFIYLIKKSNSTKTKKEKRVVYQPQQPCL